MPDLQSELSKVLNQTNFDDEPTAKEAAQASKDFAVPKNATESLWFYIRNNPASTSQEAGAGTGIENNKAATLMAQMFGKGILTRTKDFSSGYFRYSTSTLERTVMTKAECLEKANAARAAAQAKQKGKAKKLKPKAQVKATTKSSGDVVIERAKPSVAFNADEIIGGLNVMQAKELLLKLKEVFGV